MPIIINACAYCGRRAQGNFAIERDGAIANADAPAVPLCDSCGGGSSPTLRDIWARVSMRRDDGREWGPTVGPCRSGVEG